MVLKNKKTITLALIAVISYTFGFGQNIGQSIYTSYGIGEVKSGAFVRGIGMGNIGIANREEHNINILNPASYNSLEFTTFEAGALSSFKTVTSQGKEEKYNNTTFSHLALSFPISKKWGSILGLVPFSAVNYNFRDSILLDQIPVKTIYTGSGGINRVFIGNAYSPFSFLSVGLNISYLFGSITEEKIIELSETEGVKNTRINNSTQYGGFHFDYGMQMWGNISENLHVTYGIRGSVPNSMQTTKSKSVEVFTSTEGIPDTVAVTPSTSGITELPLSFGSGITIRYKDHFTTNFDANWEQWGNAKIFSNNTQLGNSLRMGFGMEYFRGRKITDGFFSKIKYRLGVSIYESEILLSGTPLTEKAIHAGIGIPLPKQKHPRELNISFIWGKREVSDLKFPSDQFFRIAVGLSLTDKWFEKRKFD